MKIIISFLIILLSSLSLAESPPIADNRVISSKTSQVFHKFDCRYAANLSSLNADIYNTYELAIEEGLRPCKTCDPQPSGIDPGGEEDPVDPNVVNVIPSIEAISLFPITGVVIQAEYCRRECNPDEVGTRIIQPIIAQWGTYADFSTVPPKPTLRSGCSVCTYFNSTTGASDYIPSEYILPIYATDGITVTGYKISPSLLVYISDQDEFYHFNTSCPNIGSTPVKMVNLDTGLASVSDAYWNPNTGILEWRVTPIDFGYYSAILNGDIAQTQLMTIPITTKQIPTQAVIDKFWGKGNFTTQSYLDWINNTELWTKNLGKASVINGSTYSGAKIEWVFQDGKWIPTVGGVVLKEHVDLDTNVTDNQTVSKKTTVSQIRIAPFEWRDTKVEIITTDTTTFEGYTAFSASPKPEFIEAMKSKWSPIEALSSEEYAQMMAEHYKELEISPPPKVVLPPEPIEKSLNEDFKLETSSAIIETFIKQKKEYDAYLEKFNAWSKIKDEKEAAWQDKMMSADMHRMEMSMMDRGVHLTAQEVADEIAHFYVSTLNGLTQEEKESLLAIRKRVIDGEVDLRTTRWSEVSEIMEKIDSLQDPNAIE